MAVSASLLQNLINDKQLIITPYDESCLVGNSYLLHNNGTVSFYGDNIYGYSNVMDSKKPAKLTTEKIPKKGYCLAPNTTYRMTLKERISCKDYTTSISACPSLASCGLNIVSEDNPSYSEDGKFDVAVSVSHPLMIYPEQDLVSLTIDAGDSGTSAVPIGGIIAWKGGPLPYGYCYCDGSNGSPNLMGMFIKGGTQNQRENAHVMTSNGSDIFRLIFIMRYK